MSSLRVVYVRYGVKDSWFNNFRCCPCLLIYSPCAPLQYNHSPLQYLPFSTIALLALHIQSIRNSFPVVFTPTKCVSSASSPLSALSPSSSPREALPPHSSPTVLILRHTTPTTIQDPIAPPVPQTQHTSIRSSTNSSKSCTAKGTLPRHSTPMSIST